MRLTLSRSGLTAIMPGDPRTQLLNQRDPGAGVLDNDALGSKRDGERFSRRLQFGVIDPPSPDVEEIPSLVACDDPGRANRPVVVRATLAGRVPTLQRQQPLGREREFVMALDPVALYHCAPRRDRRLLILGRNAVHSPVAPLGSRAASGSRSSESASPAWRRQTSPSEIGMSSSISAMAGKLRTVQSSDKD